jgi:transposase-like protein
MTEIQSQLAKLLAEDCHTIDDVEAKIKDLFGGILTEMLEAELDEHLGYAKHDNAGDNSGNSRNGYSEKTVRTRSGPARIKVPRDRNGEFEPQAIHKYQTSASNIEDQVISMYARGTSTRDIEDHLRDIYGIDVSASLVSNITDRVMPLVIEWQSRPLEPLYTIVYLDAIHFKVRQDGRIITKAAYTVLGVTLSGFKDILGIWVGESESAAFWVGVLTELRNRGVEDILIAATDNLSGFSDAIHAVFPQTEIQLCIIHQLRSSLKYIPDKKRKEFIHGLKSVYKALTLEEAELRFSEVKEKWEPSYPAAIRSWERNWLELTSYFKYPPDLRRAIYTTNAVEGYHRQIRKVTKAKTAYPTDNALRKIVYLATQNILKSWTRPLTNWPACLAEFMAYYPDRVLSRLG